MIAFLAARGRYVQWSRMEIRFPDGTSFRPSIPQFAGYPADIGFWAQIDNNFSLKTKD